MRNLPPMRRNTGPRPTKSRPESQAGGNVVGALLAKRRGELVSTVVELEPSPCKQGSNEKSGYEVELTEIHSPQGTGRREPIAETLHTQILPDQKRIPLPFLLAKVAHRITLPVLDGAHFTINAKLLGEIVEQSDRRLELHLLLH